MGGFRDSFLSPHFGVCCVFGVDSCLWSLFIFIPLFIFFFHGMKVGEEDQTPSNAVSNTNELPG